MVLWVAKKINCVAYLRYSSASQGDGDSISRQKTTLESFSKNNKYNIVKWFADEGISGTTPISERKGFCELMAYVESNGAKHILIEKIDRFARDTLVAMVGCKRLKEKGFELVSADNPQLFNEDNPTNKLISTIMMAFAEFDKVSICEKLRVARVRIRKEKGKCEGRKSVIELNPEIKALVKKLRKKPRGKKQMSIRKVSEVLFEQGYKTSKNTPLSVSQIQRIVTF